MLSESILRGQQARPFLDPEKVSFLKGFFSPKIKGVAFSKIKGEFGKVLYPKDNWAYEHYDCKTKLLTKYFGLKFDKQKVNWFIEVHQKQKKFVPAPSKYNTSNYNLLSKPYMRKWDH